ncbi:MAG: hypothetical protein WCT33_00260 [Patescibacteria group bacterium]
MQQIDKRSNLLKREIFRYAITAFISIMLITNIFVYYFGVTAMMNNTSESLKIIAENLADNVSYQTHENIISNEQQGSDDYKTIENYFKNVMDGNPLIFDIYTLRPTTNVDIMTFVVAARETQDANGDNYIDESEMRPDVGERYDVSAQADLKEGLIKPSTDNKIATDKWGQWISGYAPILNDKGETVAVLGVDESAGNVVAERKTMLISLLYMDLILLPIFLVIALLMARKLNRPYQILAQGMQRVTHGELDYRLPLAGNKTEIMFEKLFNNMLGMYDNVIKQFKKNKDDDFNS